MFTFKFLFFYYIAKKHNITISTIYKNDCEIHLVANIERYMI